MDGDAETKDSTILSEKRDPLYPRPEVWSEEGPTCPHCGRDYTPDEPHYFNPAGYQIDCDCCGKKFHVEVETSTTWTCRQKAAE